MSWEDELGEAERRPKGETDIKFAVELGLSIMLDKPVVLLAAPGVTIPPGLRRIAHAVIELRQDIDTEAGRREASHRKLDPIVRKFAGA